MKCLISLFLCCIILLCAASCAGAPTEKADDTGTSPAALTANDPSFEAPTDYTPAPLPAESRSIEELRALVPGYFMKDPMKGIEVYVQKTEDGSLVCAAMIGTNRVKTEEEIEALTYITPEELRSIFDDCGTVKESVFVAWAGKGEALTAKDAALMKEKLGPYVNCVQFDAPPSVPTPDDPAGPRYAFEDFDHDLETFIEDSKEGNYAFSPMSLKIVMAMLLAGAKGDTRAQLMNALGLTDEQTLDEFIKDFNRFREGFTEFAKREEGEKPALESANSIWKHVEMSDFLEDYKLHMEAFDAEYYDFNKDSIVKDVNKWTDEKTRHLIPELLPEDYDTTDLAFLLVNALYYQNKWSVHLEKTAEQQPFYTLSGETMSKEYLTGTFNALYYKDDDVEIVVLPMSGHVNTVLVTGSTEGLKEKLQAAESRYISLRFPSFSFETTLEENLLNAFFAERGMAGVFSDTADFSGMTESPVHLRGIVQKTNFKADEKGVTAAAVTAALGNFTTSVDHRQPMEVVFDHAFHFYLLTDASDWANSSMTVLFEGRLAK